MRPFRIALLSLVLVACNGPDGLSVEERAEAVARGREIAEATFQALSGRLQEAMATGGPAHAVDYCATAALPITDSLAREHGVRVKRTSHRLRAAHNAPDAHERHRIEAYLAEVEEGLSPGALQAQVHVLGDSIAVTLPILLNMPTCLKCHGGPAEVDAMAMARIAARYDHDKATGFSLGSLRGIWTIRWPR